jgi:hypothetical protein
MLNLNRLLSDNRLCKAVLGLDAGSVQALKGSFFKAHEDLRRSRRKDRQRKMGAGQKGLLPGTLDKLVFILMYLKCYPTYDVQGFLFGLDRTRACRWVKQLLPALEKALGRECMLPARRISSMEEFIQVFPGVRDLFIDGTERPIQRPKNAKRRSKTYSGKKKQTTRKVIIACDEKRRVGYLSQSKSGRRHDKRLLDKADILRHIPPQVTLWVDTGFQGIAKQHPNTQMPKKTTRKKPLSPEQKQNNRIISGIRVTVEHAIAGIKRMAVMTLPLRNRTPNIDDTFALLSTGLWNFYRRFA